MQADKYSWLVWLADGSAIQVDAASVAYAGATAVFMSQSGYVTAAFAAGTWIKISIMSQITGEQNGWVELRAPTKGART